MKPLRVLFFGTPSFAVPTLDALLASPDAVVVGAVTQPDKPRGRGQQVSAGPIKAVALDRALAVLQPERLRAEVFEQAFDELNADLAVVAAYGKILPAFLLQAQMKHCGAKKSTKILCSIWNLKMLRVPTAGLLFMQAT